MVGSIFSGIVEKVIPGMQAAFVNIGLEKNGFLHVADIIESPEGYDVVENDEEGPAEGSPAVEVEDTRSFNKRSDITQLLKEGQRINVQVVKESIGKKGVRLTTNVSLPGRYLVFLPNEDLRGVSRRIDDKEERQRLKEIIKSFRLPKGTGVIVRTAGIGMPKKYFLRDLRFLLNTWRKIRKDAEEIKSTGFIHHELDIVFKLVRDQFTEEVDSLIIDSRDEYNKVMKYVRSVVPYLRNKVKLYEGMEPLFHYYGVEREIRKSCEKKVWLKSGGYLVIEQTEALVSIDVNTGRSIGHTDLEDTVFRTNMEAAEEIAKQIRLRNMGGIIICDFIDMRLKRNQIKVLQKLKACVRGDKAKTNILPISEIGLVEMTRQRVRSSNQTDIYKSCDTCNGSGVVKSNESVFLDVCREIRHILAHYKVNEIKVYVHPRVATYILTHERDTLRGLERQMKGSIYVEKDPELRVDGYKIEKASV